MTDDESLQVLGERLAETRLRGNQTQTALAKEAGVSRATLQRMEGGQSTQLTNLVRVLRALGLPALHELIPAPHVRPLVELERRGQTRQRASSTRREPDPQTPGDSDSWTWGDPQ